MFQEITMNWKKKLQLFNSEGIPWKKNIFFLFAKLLLLYNFLPWKLFILFKINVLEGTCRKRKKGLKYQIMCRKSFKIKGKVTKKERSLYNVLCTLYYQSVYIPIYLSKCSIWSTKHCKRNKHVLIRSSL